MLFFVRFSKLIVGLFFFSCLQVKPQIVVSDNYDFLSTDNSEAFFRNNFKINKTSWLAIKSNEVAQFKNYKKEENRNTVYRYTLLSLLNSNFKIHQLSRFNLLKIEGVRFREEISFFDHLGILVGKEADITPKNSTIILDLSSFKEGIYFLKFKNHGVIKRIEIK